MAHPICTGCGHPHAKTEAGSELECLLALRTAIRNLLTRVARDAPSRCKGKALGGTCETFVYLIQHANGAWTPYTEFGLSHFIDCPDRALFHRRPK